MKKVLLLILVSASISAYSQNGLDTMKVRSLTLQAQDYSWLCGQISDNDSISIVALRMVRAKVQSISNPTWTTNVTMDSLPAIIVVRWYQILMNASSSEISARFSAIKTAISAKSNIAYWIGLTDSQGVLNFNQKRNLGKNKIVD